MSRKNFEPRFTFFANRDPADSGGPTLPVPGPLAGNRRRQRRTPDAQELTVGDAAAVLTPCHFQGVGVQVRGPVMWWCVPISARRRREKNDSAMLVQAPSAE